MGGGRTLSEALVPLMPRPMTSPSWTKTQPTGVSSEERANSAISMALRMKPSWYSRSGIKTIVAVLWKVAWLGLLVRVLEAFGRYQASSCRPVELVAGGRS